MKDAAPRERFYVGYRTDLSVRLPTEKLEAKEAVLSNDVIYVVNIC